MSLIKYDSQILPKQKAKVIRMYSSGESFYKREAHELNIEGTLKQVVQRAKFALAMKLSTKLTPLLKHTLQPIRGKRIYDRCKKMILNYAIAGSYPDMKIDYSKIMITSGCLSTPMNVVVNSIAPGHLQFSWRYYNDFQDDSPYDNAILVAYCEETNELLYNLEAGKRCESNAVLNVEPLSGRSIHTWMAFISKDGKHRSDSVYCGEMVC